MSRGSSPLLRWAAYIAIAIAFAVACAFLSHWQFSRNADRSAQLSLVKANYDAPPVPLSTALPGLTDFDGGYEWHPVVLHGTYLTDEQLVARNRPHGGTSAFEVLTPLKLDDGRIFIVDRGWVPAADRGDGPSAIPAPPAGDVEVVVRLRPGEALPSSGRSAPPGQVPTINLPFVAESTGAQTVTGAYGVLVSETPAVSDMPNALDAPSNDPGPFLSYAVQWILFAIMGFVFIWYVIRSERRHRREADDEDASETPSPRRPLFARREDRDMTDEDALLDRSVR
ncbi:SURF1 family protein [Microbacterium sp. SORGH_AS_0888]|uniref:SURF1 family cytochrome oxidase biogenesis protein n=1 Tax=Microbacterium sp. SORGH_AS_0888 TaxID=3041791 RepID=UPI00277D22CD|nr:SURF1 family protein [Microbacterium sp. SORGH_AS_0888]MDQ1128432.1 cytochrome oxidase assembly protein ShyY1 [Microbacterium sp. SORGH_AS_0888]